MDTIRRHKKSSSLTAAFYIPRRLYDRVAKAAEDGEMSRSWVVTIALEKGLDLLEAETSKDRRKEAK